MVKLRERFRLWYESAKHPEKSGLAKPITSLSEEDVKWIHQAAMNDINEGRKQYNLSEDELTTWRMMCTIAALNAMARYRDK